MNLNSQVFIVRMFCWLLAISAGWQLSAIHAPAKKPTLMRAVAQRLHIRPTLRRVPALSREQIRVETSLPPIKSIEVKTQKAVSAQVVSTKVPSAAELPPVNPPPDDVQQKIPLVSFEQFGLPSAPPAPPWNGRQNLLTSDVR